MKLIKKLYFLTVTLPILTSISTLQANGNLYFKNTGSVDVTVIVSHKKEAHGATPAGKTHQTRVVIPAKTQNFQTIGYSDTLENVDISSQFGLQHLKDMVNHRQTVDNGAHFEVWGCKGAICCKGV